MTAAELLAHVRGLGVQLKADGASLRVNAPSGALTDELRKALVEAKPGILALLRAAEAAPVDAGVLRDGDDDTDDERPVPVPPRRRPPPPTDPGGYCAAHGRLLTYAEQQAGACRWCADGVPPVARRSWKALPCVGCGEPLPEGRDYRCEACIGVARRNHEPEEVLSAASSSRPATESSFAVARARALEVGERLCWPYIVGYGMPVDAGKKAWERIASAFPERLLETAEAYAKKLERDDKEDLVF